jgi:hypothetical protein
MFFFTYFFSFAIDSKRAINRVGFSVSLRIEIVRNGIWFQMSINIGYEVSSSLSCRLKVSFLSLCFKRQQTRQLLTATPDLDNVIVSLFFFSIPVKIFNSLPIACFYAINSSTHFVELLALMK